MKSHLIIKLFPNQQNPRLPYWEDIINDKKGTNNQFTNEIDKIIRDKYFLNFLPTQNFKAKKDNWSIDEIKAGLDRIYRIILTDTNPNIPNDLLNEIAFQPNVEFIKMGNITSSVLPDHQWVTSQSFSGKYVENSIYLKEAHQITQGHPEIKIAILDTGIETTHPEFQLLDNRRKSTVNSVQKFKSEKDFVNILDGAQQFVGDFLEMDNIADDSVGHGSHVGGIIGAYGKKMPIGVAPKCTIIPIKVLGALKNGNNLVGAGLVDNIDTGIKYAVDQGADVINMSLGIKNNGGGLPHQDVIKYALEKEVTVVAASGNDGRKDKYYPGALDGVIAVGATDNIGYVAPFSTFGGHVSVSAPGINIYSTFLNNGYALSSGTSQAAPFVSGTIALLKSLAHSKGKKINNSQIRSIVQSTTDKFSEKFRDQKSGFGRINVLDALKMLNYNL